MELKIDAINTPDGWVVSPGMEKSLCQWSNLIAGNESGSLLLYFPANGSGNKAVKTFSKAISVSGYTNIALSICSLREYTGAITKYTQAKYVLSIYNSDDDRFTFFIPTYKDLTHFDIPVVFDDIEKYEIEALGDTEDYLVLSNMVASSEEMPLDIMLAIKTDLERHVTANIGNGLHIGTCTYTAGADQVTIATNWSWVEKYAVLRFIGTGVDETHQANNAVGNTISFTRLYDGETMNVGGKDVEVFVQIPVEIGRMDTEVLLPGICLWYIGPDPDPNTSRTSQETIAISAERVYTIREGLRLKWRITIDNEARSPELIAIATRAIRDYFAHSTVWVHGKKLWFEWSEPAAPVEPVEGYDVIPKTAYSIEIGMREGTWEIQNSGKAPKATLDVIPEA